MCTTNRFFDQAYSSNDDKLAAQFLIPPLNFPWHRWLYGTGTGRGKTSNALFAVVSLCRLPSRLVGAPAPFFFCPSPLSPQPGLSTKVSSVFPGVSFGRFRPFLSVALPLPWPAQVQCFPRLSPLHSPRAVSGSFFPAVPDRLP